jgi:predicted RNase H-like nuclease (RuvC/YqgF family)
MSELKACPYCGSLSVREGCDTPDAKWHYVECDDCHATSKADLGVSGATENWNTRPIEDALRAQHVAEMETKVEALEWRDKEICTLRKELYDARYEANLANRGFETVEKQDTNLRAELVEWKSAHDNLARQLSVANDTVEIAYEGLRELMDRIEKGGNQDEPQQA